MFQSLWRAKSRIGVLLAIGSVLFMLQALLPLALGPIFTPITLGLAITLYGLAAGEVAIRISQPRVDAQQAALKALREGDVAAGIVYLGRNLLVAVVLLIVASSSRAQTPPPANALALLPLLKAEQLTHWPELSMPSMLGAQIHKETCITERHSKCWTPFAELKTKREQGLGLGQFTRAFRLDGSTRFDALAEITAAYPKELAGLSWATPHDPRLQMRAVILKDKQIYDRVLGTATELDRLRMTVAAYNGGEGGLRSDRAVCRGTEGCDSTRWDGHVANTSLKQKTKVPGYGNPFFVINRMYAAKLVDLMPLRIRYVPYLERTT